MGGQGEGGGGRKWRRGAGCSEGGHRGGGRRGLAWGQSGGQEEQDRDEGGMRGREGQGRDSCT